MEDFSVLLGLFFAEFHPVQGPKISYQVPEALISADVFEAFSEFIIPKPQLCGRLVALFLSYSPFYFSFFFSSLHLYFYTTFNIKK